MLCATSTPQPVSLLPLGLAFFALLCFDCKWFRAKALSLHLSASHPVLTLSEEATLLPESTTALITASKVLVLQQTPLMGNSTVALPGDS